MNFLGIADFAPWLGLRHLAVPREPLPNWPIFGGLGEKKFPVLVGGPILRVRAPGGPWATVNHRPSWGNPAELPHPAPRGCRCVARPMPRAPAHPPGGPALRHCGSWWIPCGTPEGTPTELAHLPWVGDGTLRVHRYCGLTPPPKHQSHQLADQHPPRLARAV